MTKKVNHSVSSVKATSASTNAASAALNVPFPVYIRIDDEESAQFYKNNGTPLANISLRPGLPKQLYAVTSAKSQAEADTLNRELNNMNRKNDRKQKAVLEHETSMTPFDEAGVDLSTGYIAPEKHTLPDLSNCMKNDPAEIVAYTTVLNALVQEYSELSEEKQRMCDMIADKTPERVVAEEMGIRQSTLNGRKNAMLNELHNKMRDFE